MIGLGDLTNINPMAVHNSTMLTVWSLLLFSFPLQCFAQTGWASSPKEQWPTIGLTNHVIYKNGDRYVHPSFAYAGSGCLIEYQGMKYAVTAKHVLWIAQNKRSDKVTVNDALLRWVMKPGNETGDSVLIDKLINEDSTELLQGPGSTILERDMLVFSTAYASAGIQALTPRFTRILPGEKVYVIGNPYNGPPVVLETKVVDQLGLDIILEQTSESVAGLSGSPIVDSNGLLIGIFSSVSTQALTGKPVFVGISTEYLKNILAGKKGINRPKKDYGALIFNIAQKEGASKAITYYKQLTGKPRNYYQYNLRSANRNGLLEAAEKLMAIDRLGDAIEILTFNTEINPAYFYNYNVLAKACERAGQREKAIAYFKMSTDKFSDPAENEAFKELERLQQQKP